MRSHGTYTYTYDNTSQLIGVDASGGTCGATGCDESFSYDVNGNRTMTGYTTGTGNRLTSDGTYNYTYDDNGNTLTKTRISDGQKYEFSWDYRNRLTQVLLKNSGGTILQQSDYTYDAFNRRIIKSFDDDGPGSNPAVVTKTIHDGASFTANPYADFNGSNALTMRYLYGPAVDMIVARRDTSGTVAWYLIDQLGTVRDVANTTGTVIDHIRYSAYGTITAESNPNNGDRVKFTGREYDSETGTHNFRARAHDGGIGRFLSEDPIGFTGGDANLFRYVWSRPLTFRDPAGLIGNRLLRYLPDFVIQIPVVGDLCRTYNQCASIINDAGTLISNTDGEEPGTRVYIICGTLIADACGVRGVSDAFSDRDAVDGHRQGVIERLEDGVIGGATLGLIGLGGSRIVSGPRGTFVDQMSPAVATRYRRYWEQRYHNAGRGTRFRDQAAPGTRSMVDQKLSRKTGELYERETIYDQFGRRIGNNDHTTHGDPDHVNPHHHTRDPITGARSDAIPGLHPQTPGRGN